MAAAITVVMVMFLHVIFTTVTGTVSLGVATSDVIRANADATRQLTADAKAMVGPLQGGFMVVLNKQITGVSLRPGDPPTSTVRADQVAWIRSLGGDNPPSPATPAAADSFATATTTATHARVWYGHALRTDATGTSASDLGSGPDNAVAIHWIMGRQLLFLDPSPAGAVRINSTNAHPDWFVTGYGSDPTAPDDSWHKGLSDIFDADLDGIRQYFDGQVPGAGVGYPAGPYQFTYGHQRLWCNPQTPEGVDVPTWRIAQMHPYFIGNVSDLRIDLAGDYDAVVGVDLSLLDGQIKWYSHFFNSPEDIPNRWDGLPYDSNEPMTFKPPVFAGLPIGFVLGQTLPQRAIYQGGPPDPLPQANGAFTFCPGGLDWPKMLRFRYRVHDPKGLLTDRDGLPGKIFERIVQVPVQ